MTEAELTLVAGLAGQLPRADLTELSRAAARGRSGVLELRARTPSPLVRDACGQLLDAATEIGPWLSGALAGSAVAYDAALRRQNVDVVWTGPESDVETGRLTAPVVAELVDDAAREIVIVSFATYDEPRVERALWRAVERGVDITLILERHEDNPAFSGSGEVYPGLRARRLSWPATARRSGASLHAKLIVIDAHTALVGSANLTGRAMVDNLECGILLRGGRQPQEIRDHLFSLMHAGILVALAPGAPTSRHLP